ncbi:POZ domain-containing protein [Parathielavia appendiculata]|uniref:POZ domain-containing protein n=1 Tax=Parathielavia appendiculata TaxID=2587402 RepID=A0AAN6TP74_9PEZI|nr:POZ domain-containing protein [Parathielavia appendiculata]
MASQQNASALVTPEIPEGADNSPPEASSRASSVGADHRDKTNNAIEAFGLTSIYSALSSLLGSDKFSDMTIHCGDRVFKAHRAIVCSQSAFFDKALTGGFSEAATSIINLPEDDPDVMERFLEFLYTGTYDVEKHPWSTLVPVSMLSPGEINEELHALPGVNVAGTPDEDDDDTAESPALPASGGTRSRGNAGAEEPEEEYNEFDDESSDRDEVGPLYAKLLQAESEPDPEKGYSQWLSALVDMEDLYLPLRLYVMADKYDVSALKLLARERFYRAAEITWRDAESFPDVVDELYRTTPPTDLAMREIVCRLVGSGMKENKQRERMEGVMRKHGDFAVGVMNYMIQLESHIWT